MIKIYKAGHPHLDSLIPLFDDYRVFYHEKSNHEKVRTFLENRIEKNDSVIFIAYSDEEAIGFTQLYPSFSSVSLMPMYILNDLFVSHAYRNQGIGARLIEHAQRFAKQHEMKGLTLETAKDNPAQKLYEKLEWKRDEEFYHYFWDARK